MTLLERELDDASAVRNITTRTNLVTALQLRGEALERNYRDSQVSPQPVSPTPQRLSYGLPGASPQLSTPKKRMSYGVPTYGAPSPSVVAMQNAPAMGIPTVDSRGRLLTERERYALIEEGLKEEERRNAAYQEAWARGMGQGRR
jgi:hypothetical protein